MSYQNEDSYGAGRFLREQCSNAIEELKKFREDFGQTMPSDAATRIDGFLSSSLSKAGQDPSADHRGARGALVGLAGLEAQITFILSGRQEEIKSRSERAFLLLQRSIAVDPQVAETWKKALERGEVQCEKQGSLVLLSQGIYAFKVNAEGARTDLVFSDMPDNSILSRSVVGLVLTEWKVADESNASKRCREAKAQVELYKDGLLSGLELTDYRYIVVVSLKALSKSVMAADETVNGVTYRYINIVVDPDVPSKAAKNST